MVSMDSQKNVFLSWEGDKLYNRNLELMNSKKNDSLQLKNNMKFLESEAVRIYKEFEDRNSGEDKSYKTIDKILLGISSQILGASF